MRVYLVACSKSKVDTTVGPVRGADLYTGQLFTLAKRLAQREGDAWYILSARYGLLAPGGFVEAYDATLNDLDAYNLHWWSKLVAADIDTLIPGEATLVFLAGSRYRDGVIPLLPGRFAVETPLAHLGIGQQKRWLLDRIASQPTT